MAFFVKTEGALLEGLAQRMERGEVRAVVERTYGWHELAEAHRRVETGRVAGKVAVVSPTEASGETAALHVRLPPPTFTR